MNGDANHPAKSSLTEHISGPHSQFSIRLWCTDLSTAGTQESVDPYTPPGSQYSRSGDGEYANGCALHLVLPKPGDKILCTAHKVKKVARNVGTSAEQITSERLASIFLRWQHLNRYEGRYVTCARKDDGGNRVGPFADWITIGSAPLNSSLCTLLDHLPVNVIRSKQNGTHCDLAHSRV